MHVATPLKIIGQYGNMPQFWFINLQIFIESFEHLKENISKCELPSDVSRWSAL